MDLTKIDTFASFESYAAEYDAWYDQPSGQAIFAMEVACLQPFLLACPGPYLEIGVGSGRFAQALGVDYGLDPVRGLLELARRRDIEVLQGIGEGLPFAAASVGAVLIAFTLCFVQHPAQMLAEAARVLRKGGGLVLGFLPQQSPWAQYYALRGAQGHPIYRHARFYPRVQVEVWLEGAGFGGFQYRSVLFQPPEEASHGAEEPVAGFREGASFAALFGHKN